MTHSHRLATALAVGCLAVTAVQASAASTLLIDNFEEYSPGPIGTSFGSKPYIAGGNVDQFYAVNDPTQVLDGTMSGVLPTGFSAGTSSFAVVAFNNFAATGISNNLSGYDSFSVLTKSLLTSGTSTAQLQLFISDESTSTNGAVYVSNATVAESTTAETATFSLSGGFTLTDSNNSTPDTAAAVLANLGAIGVQITDPTASASSTSPNEQFAFDDLEALSSAPEPTSAALLGVAAAPLVLAHRRRRTA